MTYDDLIPDRRPSLTFLIYRKKSDDEKSVNARVYKGHRYSEAVSLEDELGFNGRISEDIPSDSPQELGKELACGDSKYQWHPDFNEDWIITLPSVMSMGKEEIYGASISDIREFKRSYNEERRKAESETGESAR